MAIPVTLHDDTRDARSLNPDGGLVSGSTVARPRETALRRLWRGMRMLHRALSLLTLVVPLAWYFLLHRLSYRLVPVGVFNAMVLNTFIRAGPCFIKLGQWVSTRPDIFPAELCDLVSSLHEDAPAHTWRYTERTLREELGDDHAAMFEFVEKEPVHSGCIAQVHKAALKADPTRLLVLKILHPHIESSIDIDLSLLHFTAAALGWVVPHGRWMSVVEACHEFDRLMRRQLDLSIEASNLDRFHRNFEGFDGGAVRIPEPVDHLCTPRLLVETFEEGESINKYKGEGVPEETKMQLARLGTRAFFKMVFDDNFVHADLHPGNMLVHEKDGKVNLVFLDAGMVFALSPRDRANFVDLFAAVCAGDGRLAADLMMNNARECNCKDPEKLRSDMQRVVDQVNSNLHRSFTLENVRTGEVLRDVLGIVRRHEVKVEPNFTNLVISIAILEGLGRSLKPDLNLFEVSVPFLLPHLEKRNLKRLVPLIKKQYRPSWSPI